MLAAVAPGPYWLVVAALLCGLAALTVSLNGKREARVRAQEEALGPRIEKINQIEAELAGWLRSLKAEFVAGDLTVAQLESEIDHYLRHAERELERHSEEVSTRWPAERANVVRRLSGEIQAEARAASPGALDWGRGT